MSDDNRKRQRENDNDTVYSNPKKRTLCMFDKIIQILKYNIWEYFIDYENNSVSNTSIDLQNFIISGRQIYEQFHPMFISRGRFTVAQALKFGPMKTYLIHDIIYDPSTFSNLFCQFPRIRSLSISGTSIMSKNILSSLSDYPSTLQRLILPNSTNTFIEPGDLPINLTDLEFGDCYNKIIKPGALPSNLVRLNFGESFDQILVPGVLPPGLKKIYFGSKYDRILIEGSIPQGLTLLSFGREFNNPLSPGILPQKLTKLTLGLRFNKPLEPGSLPETLTCLDLRSAFDHRIEPGTLPQSLRSLDFGRAFNQPLDNVLPSDLIHFGIHSGYTHSLTQVLSSLTKLESLDFNSFNEYVFRPINIEPMMLSQSLKKFRYIDRVFNQDLENILPQELEELTLSHGYKNHLMLSTKNNPGNLPMTLKKLTFVCGLGINPYDSIESIQKIVNLDFGQRYLIGSEQWLLEFNKINNTYIWKRIHVPRYIHMHWNEI